MLRSHFQFSEQASWPLSWFACFCMCSAAIAQPQQSGQQPDSAHVKPNQPKPAANWRQLLDYKGRLDDSVSRLGSIEDKAVSESSGLATAAVADCFWTINDSGKPAELFLFDSAGKKLAKVNLADAKNEDWESLGSFTFSGQRWGVVADVGDNQRLKDHHKLYFFRDPTEAVAKLNRGKKVGFSSKDFDKIKSISALSVKFSYRANLSSKPLNQKHVLNQPKLIRQDCEAVAVDPTTLDIWFVEKVHLNRDREVVPGIFVLPMPKSQLAIQAGDLSAAADAIQESAVEPVARRIGSFPVRYVSGMSFSPDGKKLIIRNYLTAHLFIRPDDKTWKQTVVEQQPVLVALPLQSQGEAICFTKDSQSVIVTSEGVRQPIWKVDLQAYFDKFKTQQ